MSLVRLPGQAHSQAVQSYVRTREPDASTSAYEHAWRKFIAASEQSVEDAAMRMTKRFPFSPRNALVFAVPFSRLEAWGLALTDLHDIRSKIMGSIEPAGARCAHPAAHHALHVYLAASSSCLHCMQPVHSPLGAGLLLSALTAQLIQSGSESWSSSPEAVASIADMILRDVLGEPKSTKGEEALWCHASLRAKTLKATKPRGAHGNNSNI